MTYYGQSSEILEVWNFFIENAIFVDSGHIWEWYWYVPSDILQDNPIYVNGILIEAAEWYYEIGGDPSYLGPLRFDLHGNFNGEYFAISHDEMWLNLYYPQNIEVSVENGYGEFTFEQVVFIRHYVTSFEDGNFSKIPENFNLTFNGNLPIRIYSTIINGEWKCMILLTNGECEFELFDFKESSWYSYIMYY